jgi:hypothetical protein
MDGFTGGLVANLGAAEKADSFTSDTPFRNQTADCAKSIVAELTRGNATMRNPAIGDNAILPLALFV